MFDAICEMKGLQALWLKWSGIKSIDNVTKLKSLQCLHIGSSTQIQSIEPLTQIEQLVWLELENIKLIRDVSPIGKCTQLVGLAIDGSMWTTQRVETLRPIGNLVSLNYLRIVNLRADDKTLRHLFPLQNLHRFHAATWWDQEEVEEIRRNNAKLER
jgi:hypothetical protein